MSAVLNIWTVLWGDKYDRRYVYALRDACLRHVPMLHNFRCITDKDLPGIATVRPRVGWPGWWQKMGLFDPHLIEDRNLWLDLDTVLVRDLGGMLREHEFSNLAAPENWSPAHHGVQSSVLMYRPSAATEMIWRRFNDGPEAHMARLHGDQEFITELEDAGLVRRDTIRDWVCSYKYHCRGRNGPPMGAAVVAFHGKPDPHEVPERWVQSAFTTTQA